MDKEITYSKDTFNKFNRLVQRKEINILGFNNMKLKELQEIGKKLDLEDVAGKSATVIRKEINNLAKLVIAGQVR